MTTMTAKTTFNLRRLYADIVGGPTFAANKVIHDGLFEAAYDEQHDADNLLTFLVVAEDLTGQKFDFSIKKTRVRIGLAGSWI